MSSQDTLADGKGNLTSPKHVKLCNVCSRARTTAPSVPAMSMEETLLRLTTELASMLGSGMTPNVNEYAVHVLEYYVLDQDTFRP